jgi:hypothetical protein
MRSILMLLLLLTAIGSAGLQAQAAPAAKSPGRATVYWLLAAILPTAAGIALVASKGIDDGPVVAAGILSAVGIGPGPSVGHLYAGRAGLMLPRVLVTGALMLVGSQSLDDVAAAGPSSEGC